METIYNSVSQLRKQHNLSQEELAQKVDVSRQTIIALEKNNYLPSLLLALKIAKIFKVSVEELFSLREVK
jgi:putative transcriptional regulator